MVMKYDIIIISLFYIFVAQFDKYKPIKTEANEDDYELINTENIKNNKNITTNNIIILRNRA